MKKLTLLVICFSVKITGNAQMLIGTAAGFGQSSTSSISWSVGEVATSTIGTTTVLTQGFQQSYLSVSSIQSVNADNWEIDVYPNPTVLSLQVKVAGTKDETMLFNITDVSGKEIKSGLLKSDIETIDVSVFPEGIYLITIQNKTGTKIKTCKVVKYNK